MERGTFELETRWMGRERSEKSGCRVLWAPGQSELPARRNPETHLAGTYGEEEPRKAEMKEN